MQRQEIRALNVVSIYAPTLVGVVPLEETNTTLGVCLLAQVFLGNKVAYEIYLGNEVVCRMNEKVMADVVLQGPPYLPKLLTKIEMTELARAVASSDEKGAVPGVWCTIKLADGALSLRENDKDSDFNLNLKIRRQGLKPVNWSSNIDKTLVANSIKSGRLPIFDPLASEPKLLELLILNDKAIEAADLADDFREQIAEPKVNVTPVKKPRRKKGL